ncbi:MAG TPA: ABC transporter substrate-binding protein [Pyrinomonadaceae bacterium]|jgi:branched-chain amino acid transport system substrate-binding protein|nr:ABC transporter substrate-binding protein [Pyrinomonadaceae bacterium]
MKRTLLSLGLAAALLASFACERRDADTVTTGGENSGPIKVGVYGDLSGQTSSFGQSTKNGITMAFDEINKAGGVNGRQLTMIFEDDQGQPAQAATVVTKLINQDRVHAVLGEVASTNTLAAAPVAQQAKIPMITPSSTNPKVTQVGDYVFRVCFTDDFQGAVAAKFAANTLKAKTAAILGDVNSDYSRGMSQFFEQEFTRGGGQIISRQSYTQTDQDFKGQLTAIRSAKPNVIFVPGYYGQVGVIAKQAKELGINAPLLGGDGWDGPPLWELGGDALNGAYMVNHYSTDDPSPSVQKFVAAYKARYNTNPDAIGALAYDAAYILADAIKRAGTTDGAKLRDAIAQTQNFAGVTGSISLNAQRDAVKPAVVFELQSRKFVYKETIQPGGGDAAATAPATGASPAGATNATASPATTTASPATNTNTTTTAPANTNTNTGAANTNSTTNTNP